MAIFFDSDDHYKNVANELRKLKDDNQKYLSSEMSFALENTKKMYSLFIQGEIEDLVCPEGTFSIGTNKLYGSRIRGCKLNKDMTQIATEAFYGSISLTSISLPKNIQTLKPRCFIYCSHMCTVIFKGIPNEISGSSFSDCSKLSDIYVPWSLGEVSGAPWGASRATIHYSTDFNKIEEDYKYFDWKIGESFRELINRTADKDLKIVKEIIYNSEPPYMEYLPIVPDTIPRSGIYTTYL